MTLMDVLILIYVIGCISALSYFLTNVLLIREKITKGTFIIYIVFFPGVFLGSVIILLFTVTWLFIELIGKIEIKTESIRNWWNTPIKK